MKGRPLWLWECRAAIAYSSRGYRPYHRRFAEFYRRWLSDGYLVDDEEKIGAPR